LLTAVFRVGVSGGCSSGRENVLAVGTLLLCCRLLGGSKRFGAHGGGEGQGHTVAAARLQFVKQALNDITSCKLLGLHIESLRPWISYFIKQLKRAELPSSCLASSLIFLSLIFHFYSYQNESRIMCANVALCKSTYRLGRNNHTGQWRRSVVKSEGVRVTQVKPSN